MRCVTGTNLTRDQWDELQAQYNQTPAEPETEGLPGKLLEIGWKEA
jgi:hypothetical protein